MAQGVLIYRCKYCNVSFNGVHVPDVELALITLMNDYEPPSNWIGKEMLHKFTLHHCGTEGRLVSIAEVVGGEKDKEQ